MIVKDDMKLSDTVISIPIPKNNDLLKFEDWYSPGLPHEYFIEMAKRTYDPMWLMISESAKKDSGGRIDFGIGDRKTMYEALTGMFSVSEEWAKTHGMPIWQFWLKEYVDGLAEHIKKTYGEDAHVLEVGAGDGWLSRLLIERGIKMTTTDNHSWDVDPDNPNDAVLSRYGDTPVKRVVPVEKISYHEAIKKYKPDLVIVSWMPYTADWSKAFRRYKSTKGYIIIGESCGGCCGSEEAFKEVEGYTVTDGFDFDNYNLCRTDSFWDFGRGMRLHRHSSTFEARRTK